jgi:hypothetical protein
MINTVKPLERFSMHEFHNQDETERKIEEARSFVLDRKKIGGGAG